MALSTNHIAQDVTVSVDFGCIYESLEFVHKEILRGPIVVSEEVQIVAEESLITTYDVDAEQDTDWESAHIFQDKLIKARAMYNAFTREWRRVYRSFLIGKYPVFLDADHLEHNYEEDMKWYRDHMNYMTSKDGFIPYKSQTAQDSAVLCHPHIGPWTGPYLELAKDATIRGQYSTLYEAELAELMEEDRVELDNKRKCFFDEE